MKSLKPIIKEYSIITSQNCIGCDNIAEYFLRIEYPNPQDFEFGGFVAEARVCSIHKDIFKHMVLSGKQSKVDPKEKCDICGKTSSEHTLRDIFACSKVAQYLRKN